MGLWAVAAALDYPAGLLVVVAAAAEGGFQVVLMIVEGIEEAVLQEVEMNLVGN